MTAEEAQNEAKCVGSQQGKSAEKGKSGADKSYMGGYAEACEVGIQDAGRWQCRSREEVHGVPGSAVEVQVPRV